MPSVLDEMTKGIMTQKAAKATSLTPVAGESKTSVASMAALPKDLPGQYMSHEQLRDAVRILREAADAVEALLGGGTEPAAAPAERKSDARFAGKDPVESFDDRMARISADAQAATFASADAGSEPEPEVSVTTASGEWACPNHGTTALVELKAKGGLTIRACDKCDEVQA